MQEVQGAQLEGCGKVQDVQLPQPAGEAAAQEGRQGRKVGSTPLSQTFFFPHFSFFILSAT
jgi:hypothetical protein